MTTRTNEKTDLMLEKVNAQAIVDLRREVGDKFSHLDAKIDKVLLVVTDQQRFKNGSGNGSGNGTNAWSIGLVFTVLLGVAGLLFQQTENTATMVDKMDDAIKKHEKIGMHPDASKEISGLTERLSSIASEVKGIRENIKMFQSNRFSRDDWDRLHGHNYDPEQNIRLKNLEEKLVFLEQNKAFHDVAKGNVDSVQDEKLRWLEKKGAPQ